MTSIGIGVNDSAHICPQAGFKSGLDVLACDFVAVKTERLHEAIGANPEYQALEQEYSELFQRLILGFNAEQKKLC